MIYLIRHAEKIDSTVHAELTTKGLSDSFAYGKKLKSNNVKINLIITSPIKRCIQTAQKISEGYGEIKIKESTLLGNPGIYVNNGDIAMKIFNKYKLIDIINMQLSHQIIDGFNNVDTAKQELLFFMMNQKDNTLYISHDAIIEPFIKSIANIKNINEEEIVAYLDGYSNHHKDIKYPWKKESILSYRF